ncbi:MAG: glycosyltransferase family 4 protein [Clostridia bacterium]|nr:glycosyltransferase family 4 protein [Clostridia bacterium]
MKRVVFVSHSKNLYGAEKVLLNIAKALASQYEVHVVVPGKGLLKKHLDQVPGIHTHILWMPILTKRVPGVLVYIAFYFITVLRLMLLYKRLAPQVVYNNALHNLYGSTAAYLLGIPNVWHLHEKYYGGSIGKVLLWFVRRFSTRIIFISQYVKETFLQHAPELGDKSLVVYNGIEPESRKIGDSIPGKMMELLEAEVKPVVMGTVCQLSEQKRPFDLVLALETLLKRYPQMVLVFAGDGYYRSELEKFIAARNLTEQVLLLGFVENVPPLLEAIDIFVCPFEGEGFGLVAIEAMALRKPVIAADSGAFPEIIRNGESGLLFPVGDVGALVERVERLIESRDLYQVLGEKGFQASQEFSLIRQAEDISRLIDQL